MIDFDPDTHTYRVQGAVKPSVTQILKPLCGYEWVSQEVLERKGDIGRATHKAVELWLSPEGLDETSLHESVRPYFDAYRRFHDAVKPEILATEQQVYHETMGYCGTLDLEAFMFGELSMPDIKTVAQMGPVVGIQTAAYSQARGGSHVRYGLQLRPDGTYRLEKYSDPTDWPTFLSLINVHRWKQKHNQEKPC